MIIPVQFGFNQIKLFQSMRFKVWGWFMMFNATFNTITVKSAWSVLLVQETGVPGENQRPVASQ
jgi:hypothetical protein